MKKIMAILCVVGLSMIFAGCSPASNGHNDSPSANGYNGWEKHSTFVRTKVVTIENHKYVLAQVVGESVSIVHAASCECGK